MHSVYRMRIVGAENVPTEGGALIVCNHVSFADPALLLCSLRRPIRFLMFRPLYEAPLFHPFAKAMQAIPISGSDGREKVEAALAEAKQRIKEGELVGIFAEGGITRTGQMLAFRSGLETIMDGTDAAIIPAYLDQVWGSIFSFSQGKFLWKVPKELPYPVTVAFGPALPASSRAEEVRQAVQELGAESFDHRKPEFQNILDGVKRSVRRKRGRICAVDSFGSELSFSALLASARQLAKEIEQTFPGKQRIAVIGCPSTSVLVANVALVLCGRSSVNLDQNDEAQLLAELMRGAAVDSVIAANSQALAKAAQTSANVLPMADKPAHGAFLSTLSCFIYAFGAGRAKIREREAAVVFTRGRTGPRKAVRLSHGNICSNIESVFDVLELGSGDVLAAAVPAPNAFAVTLGMWLPLLGGMKMVYHASESDVVGFAQMIQAHKATHLLLSSHSLERFIADAAPEALASVKRVFVGGSGVAVEVAKQFQEHFGVQLYEGYGTAELSPMALVNVPDYDYGKGKQVGRKIGSAGHPLPGVAVRIASESDNRPLPIGDQGLLLVKGPNVMLGYVQDGEKQAVEEGWFNTGDLASLDKDGFVSITS